jgi:1,4-dihydroxy-2-naphthoyl-CoA synthase
MNENVKSEIADGVMTLTLQRPEKKNALTGVMYDALSDALVGSARSLTCPELISFWPDIQRSAFRRQGK